MLAKTTKTDTEAATYFADTVKEAFDDALTDNDGRPHPDALTRHLAKRGLLIVDAAEHYRMTMALMLIGSCASDGDTSTALALAAKAARAILSKGV